MWARYGSEMAEINIKQLLHGNIAEAIHLTDLKRGSIGFNANGIGLKS